MWRKHGDLNQEYLSWLKNNKEEDIFDAFDIFNHDHTTNYCEELDTTKDETDSGRIEKKPSSSQLKLKKKWINFSCGDKRNAEFYKFDMNGDGCAYLVANSSFHIKSKVKEMNKTDIKMNI